MLKNEKNYYVSLDTSIKKSNELSLSKLQKGLSMQQSQLLSYCIFTTQSKDKASFHKADFERFFGIQKYRTEDAFQDAKVLLNLMLSFTDLKNDKFKFVNVFETCNYDKGLFEFTWTNIMFPHILELQKNYVLLDLIKTSKFTNKYTWKMYEYLKGKHGYFNLEFTKEELLRLFAVEDTKSYIRNSSTFKKRVLDPVIDDLNNFTEMDIRYEELKSGRITTGYKFFWSFGKVVKLASKKQIDDLLSYVDTILRGMDSVLTLPKSKRLEALDIFDEVTKIKEQVNFNLEEAKVEGLKMLLKQYLTRYQELYLIKEEEKKVPFYNWLEERE